MEHKRKHISQMTKEEVGEVRRRISKIDKSKCTLVNHAVDRLRTKNGLKNITRKNIMDVLDNYSIIEYGFKNLYGKLDERAVLSSNDIYFNHRGKCRIFVVYSIRDNRIVTVYSNDISDNHITINMDIYDENLKIC